MFKKLAVALFSLAFVAVPLGEVSAGPPEQVDAPDYFELFLDADEGKSTWINITALDFCTWAFFDFQGPAPVVDDAVPATLNFTGGNGEEVVASIKTDGLYVEVWNLDNPDGPFESPCEDILDQLLAGGDPWATGTTSINARTNNLFFEGEGSRVLSAGFSGTAQLDASGSEESYRYKFTSHFNTGCSDFRCAVTNTSLRMI